MEFRRGSPESGNVNWFGPARLGIARAHVENGTRLTRDGLMNSETRRRERSIRGRRKRLLSGTGDSLDDTFASRRVSRLKRSPRGETARLIVYHGAALDIFKTERGN